MFGGREDLAIVAACTDLAVGALLHAYELGALSEQEAQQFERHLMECEHCLEEVRSFEETSRFLRDDAACRELAKETNGEVEVQGRKPRPGWFLRYLWPPVPIVLRPAFSYSLVIVAIVLTAGSIRHHQPVVPGQHIILTATRAAEEPTLQLGASPCGLVLFEFQGGRPGKSYFVQVTDPHRRVVYEDSSFTNMSSRETGALVLNLDAADPGIYRLVIADGHNVAGPNRQEYRFRVRK